MQIKPINSTNFGATPDFETRKILLNAKLKGVNTNNLENLMKETYADKYIMVNYTDSKTSYMGIYSKDDGSAELKKSIVRYNPLLAYRHPKLFVKLLTNKLEKLKQERSQKQIFVDEIENKFGKYDESYKYSNGYSN